MMKNIENILVLIISLLVMMPFVYGEAAETDKYQLEIVSDSDWCSVEIAGMGVSPTAYMLKHFITGEKTDTLDIYDTSMPGYNFKIIRISRGQRGIVTVTLKQNGAVIAGPWKTDDLPSVEINDTEMTDPWLTEYYTFRIGSGCDISGFWINSTGSNYMKVVRKGRSYSAESIWIPSGDRFVFNLTLNGQNFNISWEHPVSDAKGTASGYIDEDCTQLTVDESEGNYTWTGIEWYLDSGQLSQLPEKVADLSGNWRNEDDDTPMKITHKKGNDYIAEINKPESGYIFKIYFHLIGNSIEGSWFVEGNEEATGSITGYLGYDEGLYIKITASSGSFSWDDIVWIKQSKL
jgi:hypothetical protein